jgi:hypothetical protein
MAITYVRHDTRGPLLQFCTDTGREWTVSLETLSQIFGPEVQKTLDDWMREMAEDATEAPPTCEQDRQIFRWRRAGHPPWSQV